MYYLMYVSARVLTCALYNVQHERRNPNKNKRLPYIIITVIITIVIVVYSSLFNNSSRCSTKKCNTTTV